MRLSAKTFVLLLAAAAIVAACAAPRTPAPVVERTVPSKKPAPAPASAGTRPAPVVAETKSDTYAVKPGDTLFSIALEHGLDHRELAIWNGIDNPGALRVGQQLRVTAPAGAATTAGAVTAPLKAPPGTVQAKPLGAATPPPVATAPPSGSVPPGSAVSGSVVSEPKAVRLPYSEQALAQLAKPPETIAQPRIEAPRVEPPRSEPRAEKGSDVARGPDDLDWAWPVRGKVIGTFNDSTSKGITIAGRLGQPVLASAPGRVIFSGTGIRGFGKLIVIKHNNTYLSVYAHNNELVVKEGQNVSKGQKIAEMGNSDADQVKLHFEIRRFGKPIDPLKLLPSPG